MTTRASILALAGLSSTAWATSTTNEDSYLSRGVFLFDKGNMNSISANGDGATTIAHGNNNDHWVRISALTEDGQVAIAQELSAVPTGSSDFGRTVDLYGNSRMGNHLLVGDENYAHYYTGGDWNTWSLQQVFQPPSDYPTGEFGKNVYVNKQNYEEFISACPSCGENTIGRVYAYESKGPKNTWTQSAVLEAAQETVYYSCDSSHPLGYSILLGSSVARISGDNIIASTDLTYCQQGGIILFSKRHGAWSQQQTFWSALSAYNSAAVEKDTIAISAPGNGYGTHTEVGSVFIQYPNTPEYGSKPAPGAPTQWSLHQILYPPAPQDSLYFGSDLSIHDNRLYIGQPGSAADTSKIYFYERPEINGYWSLQQVLSPPTGYKGMSTHDVFGTTIFALASNADPQTGTVVYENRYEWDCLIISLEDQFGDGWDTARLQILTPGSDEPDYFSPSCTSPNPFEFRYCPRYSTPGYQGLYKLSVVDGPKSKFFWEIQWRVYEESSGEWYRGNHATRMDFHFDAVNKEMSRKGIFHDLPANLTSCHTCPGKPEEKKSPEKPRPGMGRKLKSETHAPSVSPAPTLAQTLLTGDVWRYLTLTTTGEAWFNNQHQGTNYYISDTQGHRLLSTGTSCLVTPSACYQVIPDGQYVLRVSGGLNKFAGDHEWEFCGRRGAAGEQLNFIVKDSKCDAIATFTTGTYCSTVLHSTVVVSVELEMFGISETTGMDQLSSADLEALSTALASLVGHGLASSDIKLTAITNQFGHAIFDVAVLADAVQFGADPHDLDSMEGVVTQLSTLFTTAASSGQLLTALTSTTVQGAQFFQSLQAVQFVHSSLSAVNPHADSVPTAMVTNVAPVAATETVEASSNDTLFYMVLTGYAASALAVVGLVAYVVNQVRSPVARTAVSTEESTHAPIVTANTKSPETSARRQPKSVDSTQKSQQMNTIMIADLIQMVKEVSCFPCLFSLSLVLTPLSPLDTLGGRAIAKDHGQRSLQSLSLELAGGRQPSRLLFNAFVINLRGDNPALSPLARLAAIVWLVIPPDAQNQHRGCLQHFISSL
jgi:hypothetical protein